jgi:hypothetical protein
MTSLKQGFKKAANGKQARTSSRNGLIRNGGLNDISRVFELTGI